MYGLILWSAKILNKFSSWIICTSAQPKNKQTHTSKIIACKLLYISMEVSRSNHSIRYVRQLIKYRQYNSIFYRWFLICHFIWDFDYHFLPICVCVPIHTSSSNILYSICSHCIHKFGPVFTNYFFSCAANTAFQTIACE